MIDFIEIPCSLVKAQIINDAVPGVPFIIPVYHRARIQKGRKVVAIRIDPEDPSIMRLYHEEEAA